MPNWCDTTYKAVGAKESVNKFYDLAKRAWEEKSKKYPEADTGWLGMFIHNLGGKPEDYYCRGWMRDEPYIHEFSEDYAECTIYCDTAWGELDEWRHFVESEIDDMSIFYVAIEPGCCVYATNDDEYVGMYYVDCSPEQPDCPIMSEDEVCDYFNKYFDADVKDIGECHAFVEKYNVDNPDEFVSINEMEYIEA